MRRSKLLGPILVDITYAIHFRLAWARALPMLCAALFSVSSMPRGPGACATTSAEPRTASESFRHRRFFKMSSFFRTVRKYSPSFHDSSVLITPKIVGRISNSTCYSENRGDRKKKGRHDRRPFPLVSCRLTSSVPSPTIHRQRASGIALPVFSLPVFSLRNAQDLVPVPRTASPAPLHASQVPCSVVLATDPKYPPAKSNGMNHQSAVRGEGGACRGGEVDFR